MKKNILIICITIINTLLLSSCSMYYLNDKSIEEIIDIGINTKNNVHNTNNKGYRYYLPIDFTVSKDEDYVQVLLSKSNSYYMYVDLVSYYYKTHNEEYREEDDYIYYSFENKDKKGFLHIKKKDDTFCVELCYNYAIIEVEVEEKDLRYAISQSISILNSIKYNDLVINKVIGDKGMDTKESAYTIPKPDRKSNQNILKYLR